MRLIDIKNQMKSKNIEENDKFTFLCHKNLSCFNRCCRNLNMFLYPYDVLRLKNNLNIKSDSFIENHVDIIMRKGNYFPDVLLRMNDDKEMTCPFLTGSGCSVYLDRPYSCRTFPIEQGAIHNSNPQSIKIMNFFKPPSFCMGQHETEEWTTRTWGENQHLEAYSKMTIKWSEIKQLFNVNPWEKGDPNGVKAKMAFMAVYNTDIFREFIFESSFLKRYKIKNKSLKKIKHSEIELLNLGFHWIKLFLWGLHSNIITSQ